MRMNHLPVSEELWIDVYMASAGSMSGTLSDWPNLDIALKQMGIDLPQETAAPTVIRICRAVVSAFYCQASLDESYDLANILVSGTDEQGCPVKSRRRFTSLLREIITATRCPSGSGHRWDFR